MENMYDPNLLEAECQVCGKKFKGAHSKLESEKCAAAHERVFISMWDYELPGIIRFFNTGDRQHLPGPFVKKLKKLEPRILKG